MGHSRSWRWSKKIPVKVGGAFLGERGSNNKEGGGAGGTARWPNGGRGRCGVPGKPPGITPPAGRSTRLCEIGADLTMKSTRSGPDLPRLGFAACVLPNQAWNARELRQSSHIEWG